MLKAGKVSQGRLFVSGFRERYGAVDYDARRFKVQFQIIGIFQVSEWQIPLHIFRVFPDRCLGSRNCKGKLAVKAIFGLVDRKVGFRLGRRTSVAP